MTASFRITEWQQLQDRLRANPTSYDQDEFCGDAYSIAGHLFKLRGTPLVYITATGLNRWGYVDERSHVRALAADNFSVFAGLVQKTGLQPEFDWVFRPVSRWPEPYKSAYAAATTEHERVEVACQVIDHVIAHHGKPVLRFGYGRNGAFEHMVELEVTPEQVEQLRSIGFPIAGGGEAASEEVA